MLARVLFLLLFCRLASAETPTGWNWRNPIHRGATLRAVWAADDDDVWAVGDGGTILHRDRSGWINHSAAVPGETSTDWTLEAIWGSESSDIWIVGTDASTVPFRGVILHWDGRRWSSQSFARRLSSVWGVDRERVWIGGDGGVYQRAGAEWKVTLSTAVDSIWGTSDGDLWAAGYNVFHFNGRSWRTLRPACKSGGVRMVWGSGGHEVFAGGRRCVGRLIDQSWRSFSTRQLDSVKSRGVLNVTALGGARGGPAWLFASRQAAFWSGSAWRATADSPTEALGVSGGRPERLWAVGEADLRRWDGGKWQNESGLVRLFLKARANALGGLWLLHPSGVIRYAPGQSREFAEWIPDAHHELHDLWSVGGEAWAVGEGGYLARHHEGSWQQVWLPSRLSSVSLVAVWASGADDVWIGGNPSGGRVAGTQSQGGIVAHWDGKVWSVQEVPVELAALWGDSVASIWLVGTNDSKRSVLLRRASSIWNEVASSPVLGMTSITGNSIDDIWIAGDGVWHWDGAVLRALRVVPGERWFDVAASGGEAWLVNRLGRILHYRGDTATITETGATLNAVVADAAGNVWCAGAKGAILQGRQSK